VLVIGFVAVGALAVFVIRRAPKDGSDIGRDPRSSGDHRTGDGHGDAGHHPQADRRHH
jgi:hypothetical protein